MKFPCPGVQLLYNEYVIGFEHAQESLFNPNLLLMVSAVCVIMGETCSQAEQMREKEIN